MLGVSKRELELGRGRWWLGVSIGFICGGGVSMGVVGYGI